MLVMVDSRYPASSMKRAIEVFTSPELPKRAEYITEIASFVHGDHEGYHTMFLIEVDDAHAADYVIAQAERATYMATRIPGFTVEARYGQSVPQAIATAVKHLPK